MSPSLIILRLRKMEIYSLLKNLENVALYFLLYSTIRGFGALFLVY